MVLAAVPASAQTARPPVEFSAGYNYLYLTGEEDEDGQSLPAGWYGEVSGNVTPMLAIVGQVTGNYKGIEEDGEDFDISVHTYSGGLRFISRQGQANPFVHVLFGGLNFGVSDCDECGDKLGMMQLGGGVNLLTQAPVGLRFGGDWIHAFGDNGGNAFRFAVGINFGR
jgi:hypothetical protein